MKPWKRQTGYQGKIYYVRGDLWACCVLEDVLKRHHRFLVMVMNQRHSAHATLARAKACADQEWERKLAQGDTP